MSTCDTSNTSMGMSTFLAPDPTNLVNLTTLNTVEPTAIQTQFIPTLWNSPSTASTSIASTTTSAEAISSNSGSPLSNSAIIAIAVVIPVVVVLAIAGIITFCWRRRAARRREEATRGTYKVARTKSPMLYNAPMNEIDGRAHVTEMAGGDSRIELSGTNHPVELSGTAN
ncbi:hypothetical protein MMC26_000845 [Xylographa opegraphella]|nr:hypothetical protein [Xylographa opegraphella]